MPRKSQPSAQTPSPATVLALQDLVIDPAIQPRGQLDYRILEDYTELYRAVSGSDDEPDILPPLKVMIVDGAQLLTDGFHRHAAATKAGRTALRCVVTEGTRQDAIREAALANIKHGLPYTREDRERVLARLLDDPVYVVKSIRDLGFELGMSHTTVQRFKDRRQAAKALLDAAPDVVSLAKQAGLTEEKDLALLAAKPVNVPALVEQAVRRVVHDPQHGPQETLVPQALDVVRYELKTVVRQEAYEQEQATKRKAARTPQARAERAAQKEAEAAKQAAYEAKREREDKAWRIESFVNALASLATRERDQEALAADVVAVHQNDRRKIVTMMTQAVAGFTLLLMTCETAGWEVQTVRAAWDADSTPTHEADEGDN